MEKKLWNRRDWIMGMGAVDVGLSTGFTMGRANAADITIGFLYVGAHDDFAYNQSHAEAAAAVKKMAGVKVLEEESVPETQAVQKSMQGMISQDGAN